MTNSLLVPAVAMARHHISSLVAVMLAVAGGAAMITASLVIAETGLTSRPGALRLSGADLVVSAAQSVPVAEDLDIALPERMPVPGGLVDALARVPGVDRAVHDIVVPITLADGQAAPASTWASTALGRDGSLEGRAPHGPEEVVIDAGTADAAGLRVGDEVSLAVAGERVLATLSGVADVPFAGLFVDEATARQVRGLGEGSADLVVLRVAPGADVDDVATRVERLLESQADQSAPLQVVSGSEIGAAERPEAVAAASELLVLTLSMAGTLLFLVGCVVTSALSVAVGNQRRDLALLRAVGASPRHVRSLIAAQATVVAAVALVPGIVAGHLGAGLLASAFVDAGLMPRDLELAQTPLPGLIVLVVTLATVQVTARCAAWRTSRLPATTAVAGSRTEGRSPGRVRALIGVVTLALGIATSSTALFVRSEEGLVAAASGTLVAILGVALLAPVAVQGLASWLATRADFQAPPVWLALRNSRANSQRTAGSVTVLVLAIGLVLTQYYVQTTTERAVASDLDAGGLADATVLDTSGTGVATGLVAEIARQQGVDAAVGMSSTTVVHTAWVLGEKMTTAHRALALGHGADQVVDPSTVRGDLSDLTGETVALSAATARLWGTDVGEPVELVLADGSPARVRVVAVYERGLGFGSLITSLDLLPGARDRSTLDAVLVAGDVDAVVSWADSRPDLVLVAGAALTDTASADASRWISLMVVLAMFCYVLVGVANSLFASTARRRDEFRTLRVIGATRRQGLAMVFGESTLLTMLALAGGVAVAVLPMTLLGIGAAGRPWPQGPLWVMPAVAGAVVLVAYVASTAAAARALRVR